MTGFKAHFIDCGLHGHIVYSEACSLRVSCKVAAIRKTKEARFIEVLINEEEFHSIIRAINQSDLPNREVVRSGAIEDPCKLRLEYMKPVNNYVH
ncbi:MAG: hypothetical protein KW806_03350 [Candidatus Yanofskybacteria bacterium]|nr:hypothetical protein [Candidatus Yanofskybacteria bacterium]